MEKGECHICPYIPSDFHDSHLCSIGEKGLYNVIAASRERGDHELEELFEKAVSDFLQNPSIKLKLHIKCRTESFNSNSKG